jgi:hypothetical protein
MTQFDNWKQSLPSKQRREVEKWYREQLNGPAVEEARVKIESWLSIHTEHDRLVGKIALLFIENGEIANKTNCQFITFDPLCELGGSNADILIFEPEEKIVLIIEVKIGDRNPISDLKHSKKGIDDNLEYLQKIVNSKVKEVIYILVVRDFVRATELKNDCNDNAFALGYVEKNVFKLHSGSMTKLKKLDSILSNGSSLLTGDSIYVMLSSHLFHILSNTLVEIIREKLKNSKMSGTSIEAKEFTRGEFREAFQRLAYISSVEQGSDYEKYIGGRVESIIHEGLQSGLIVELNKENRYRIYSQATISIGKIGKTMEKKYIDYYIEKHKKKIAEENTISRHNQKYGRQQMRFDV